MRFSLLLTLTLGISCTDKDGNELPDREYHGDEEDSVPDETDADTDSDTDADTDSDTDVDTGTADECVNAADLCGQTLTVTLRESWGASIPTQNNTYCDFTDPYCVMDAVINYAYPPIPDWPDVSSYPASYAVGDELNSYYGWGWYADELDWPASTHTPVALTVHHTAGEISSTCDAYMTSITNYHIFGEGHGWGDVGYQFVVCEDDAGLHVMEGRYPGTTNPSRDPWSSAWVVGAHTSGFNTGNVGVSLVGNFVSAEPTTDEMAHLKAVVARLLFETGLDAGVIGGHRDYSSTTCPGDALYALLPEVGEHADWCSACGY